MVIFELFHIGGPIRLCEENGRRFWSASIPDPSGWVLPQEFCSQAEAVAYADDKVARNELYASRSAAGRRVAETLISPDTGAHGDNATSRGM